MGTGCHIFEPDYAFSPGETIMEWLEWRKMGKGAFAQALGLSGADLDSLLRGELELSGEITVRLEVATGMSAAFWESLEAGYRNHLTAAARGARQ